ncbi:hypothetical protein EGH22_20130 [Halomicroarcula sp. F28]|uniref:hypothetical protein n=1 Tax=Haloarcula salinisoli TaxID=2487746 RepID=UPI001C731424|nr:hypothetical protein [Halomicroarcula salinisoli]MBX0288643.1 hypothetical protein [Halomicroarcula salinisoli]
MTRAEIIERMRETAEPLERPQFVTFDMEASIRITLSDGVHYVPSQEGQSVVRSISGDAERTQTPLEVHIGQTGVHRPCRTEVIDIVGHSKHWLDGDIDRFHLPAATPLAKIDQCRLEAALSRLYDEIEPVQLSFETFENSEGWHTPEQTVPGCESLRLRHSVEWVLENFSQQRADDTIEFKYTGDELYPNANGAFGPDPDEKFEMFLRKGFPDSHFASGATAIVAYPEDRTVFRKQSPNKWEIIPS